MCGLRLYRYGELQDGLHIYAREVKAKSAHVRRSQTRQDDWLEKPGHPFVRCRPNKERSRK